MALWILCFVCLGYIMLYIVWVNRVMAIPTPSRESFVFRQVSWVTAITDRCWGDPGHGIQRGEPGLAACWKGDPGHGDFYEVRNLGPEIGRGIDSRNRVWNWVAKLHRLARRYDNWFLSPIAGFKFPSQVMVSMQVIQVMSITEGDPGVVSRKVSQVTAITNSGNERHELSKGNINSRLMGRVLWSFEVYVLASFFVYFICLTGPARRGEQKWRRLWRRQFDSSVPWPTTFPVIKSVIIFLNISIT
jgi:hypothetical protein